MAIVGERRGMTRRKRGEKRVNEAIAEREEEGGRGSKPRGGERERGGRRRRGRWREERAGGKRKKAGGGREERNCTLSIPGACQLFSGFTNPG